MHPDLQQLSATDHAWILEPIAWLSHCDFCPRNCGVNRLEGQLGYCKLDAGFHVSSVVLHQGEEPPVGGQIGICNVFFSHCNLQCLYCQNHQISGNHLPFQEELTSWEHVVDRILWILDQGATSLGFVSPSHQIPQMISIIRALNRLGRFPVIVYNSNGFDSIASLRLLESIVDVYLPDLKYMDPKLSQSWSGSSHYPEVARAAVLEMYRQKGARLICDEDGKALFGMIVRHLVLPGQTANSLHVLQFLAAECSTQLSISLMAQYHPTQVVLHHPLLKNTIEPHEYEAVKAFFHQLGFENGWVQELESHAHYLPDFSTPSPFSS